ncbi:MULTISPECIES: magnesium-translocating P-type ATPase [Streptomyces]|uniref:Magnesium-transporting ATPase, P-type 1 n=1 Tax=Streptomyces venezuelae TaxID=54571 RepID=A0A5P2BLE5_STRVZ|nr:MULTISPECIES: magnesium-translocating P-type ATPase [Streptomyces]NDZ99198.1 magnesium-translocating P-type ATPase [Streptomyces sp. SID10116]MYY81918.1 magnesium-translocating P-type ATPase [Streptomyces sp. SID335]MYZ16329.1 magnesium-translocating P-type ATPase [Streptomyces sp. SID337]NDZ89747.1 magnesium-translocating P-type ATPase [Streptomyces sp. SID10115]NEB43620.1 magnesium-translocating P-type ATPase [Streptomyces sp. SID339]
MNKLIPQVRLAPPGENPRPAPRTRKAAELDARTREAGARLAELSALPARDVLRELNTTSRGLRQDQVLERIQRYGENTVAHERAPHWTVQLAKSFRNPFIGVLVVLAAVMYWQDPADPGVYILTSMVLISALLRFWQEFRSSRSAEALKKLVTTSCAVQRRRSETADTEEIPMAQVVPGDLVRLAAGDLVPADLRLLTAKDLMVSQAALSGESLPVAKADTRAHDLGQRTTTDPVEADNLCLMGTSVTSGTATGVAVATGAHTYFGSMAGALTGDRPQTAFDVGVRRVSFLLIRFMLVMVPVVFAINGFTKGDWDQALLFSISVAVGLTPEMLPMVVSANLARGAVAMSRHQVVVKQLNAIQNLGAMDVLCTDKTGTLTEDRIVLDRCLGPRGEEDREVLEYAYLNSHFQTGLRNLMDQAVVDRVDEAEEVVVDRLFTMIDEIPFDFARRRMSVVLRRNELAGPVFEHTLITKGAVEEVLDRCCHVMDRGERVELTPELRAHVTDLTDRHNREGLRVLAVATRTFPVDPDAAERETYSVADETELTLVGFLAFLDPPKKDAAAALRALAENGVAVKVVTGDNELVAGRVCADVGLDTGELVTGATVDLVDDVELIRLARTTTVFAKVNPVQKARIVRALKADGHTVGFLGDGINDAAALREADVGVSVDTAVDIAKESADIILLKKDLMVLEQGVLMGRQTFGNTIKYIKMTASSNFGNVFSVLVASAFIPFQPMLAIHLLVQNLCYDISQLAIPWDRMDKEYLKKPRAWDAGGIGRFMVRVGPVSSVFDITTFLVLWHVFGADSPAEQTLFQTGWFVEGLLSQTLIVHMIRTRKIPFVRSRASLPVLVMTGAVMLFGLWLPFSPLAGALSMEPLPMSYFPWLAGTLLAYCALTQAVKGWYIRRYHEWL